MDEIFDFLLNVGDFLGDSFDDYSNLDSSDWADPSDGIDSSGDVSFKGSANSDYSFYDSKIETVSSDIEQNVDYAAKSIERGDISSAESYIKKAHQDNDSLDFWKRAKDEAILQDKKDQIFLDDINAKLDIVEKYRIGKKE